jgi:diguanylate cyclase (GGDEF)-like protein
LREVATRLTDSVRSYDAVSRYGGEEFLIVLNGCRTRLGTVRADSIRRVIHKSPVDSVTGPVPISMSFGVAGTEEWPDANAEQLIREADVALYRAKEWGRNRSVLAKPSGLEEIHAAVPATIPVSAI